MQDIYYAEQQIIKALPKMIDKATNRDLADRPQEHLDETTVSLSGSIRCSKKLGMKPKGTDCPAIDGIIKEADQNRRRNRR